MLDHTEDTMSPITQSAPPSDLAAIIGRFETAHDRVKASADGLAEANRKKIQADIDLERERQGKQDDPKIWVPTNRKLFRRMAGLRNGDLK